VKKWKLLAYHLEGLRVPLAGNTCCNQKRELILDRVV